MLTEIISGALSGAFGSLMAKGAGGIGDTLNSYWYTYVGHNIIEKANNLKYIEEQKRKNNNLVSDNQMEERFYMQIFSQLNLIKLILKKKTYKYHFQI